MFTVILVSISPTRRIPATTLPRPCRRGDSFLRQRRGCTTTSRRPRRRSPPGWGSAVRRSPGCCGGARQGIVRITVVEQGGAMAAAGCRRGRWVSTRFTSTAAASPAPGQPMPSSLSRRPSVGRWPGSGLVPGDVLLVSSGRTVYEVSAARPSTAPRGGDRPGRRRAGPAGGVVPDQRDHAADRLRGWADGPLPVRPGAARTRLCTRPCARPDDPARPPPVAQARCVLMGVGRSADPPGCRSSCPPLRVAERGGRRDVCARSSTATGARPPRWRPPIAVELRVTRSRRRSPSRPGRGRSSRSSPGARAGFFYRLVTDPVTAEQILAASA